MFSYDLLIIYKNGKRKVISEVKSHGINENDCFYFVKNNYLGFIPKERITFFGREFDYENN